MKRSWALYAFIVLEPFSVSLKWENILFRINKIIKLNILNWINKPSIYGDLLIASSLFNLLMAETKNLYWKKYKWKKWWLSYFFKFEFTSRKTYIIKIGTNAIKKYGVDVDIVTNVVMRLKITQIKSLKLRGKVNSIEFISLLNLFRMRPIGVVSKKDNFDRISDLSMSWWSFRDERSVIRIEKNSAASEKKSKNFSKIRNSLKIIKIRCF